MDNNRSQNNPRLSAQQRTGGARPASSQAGSVRPVQASRSASGGAARSATGGAVRPSSGNARTTRGASTASAAASRTTRATSATPASASRATQTVRPASSSRTATSASRTTQQSARSVHSHASQAQTVRPVTPAASRARSHAKTPGRQAGGVSGGSFGRQAGGASGGSSNGKGGGKGPWRVVFWLSLVVLVLSLGALAFVGFSYWKGQNVYDEIAKDAFEVPSDTEATTLSDFNVDWAALREVNSDVVAWIYIPGTEISYPVVHREGDESYYLTHNFNGETTNGVGAEYGAIMLSGENRGDFSDAVNIIYGHHMSNGMMFAYLEEFKKEEIFNEHRTVYLLTPEGNYLLKTFSLVHAHGTDTTIVVPTFRSGDARTEYMQDKIDRSIVTPDPEGSPAADIKKAFALSTCDGVDNSYRYVLFCEVVDFYEAGEAPSGEGQDGETAVNPDDVNEIDDAVDERVS